MRFVGWRRTIPIRSAQPLEFKGEDIVYSTIERRSGKASQPTTTRCFTVITIILNLKGTLAFAGVSLFIKEKGMFSKFLDIDMDFFLNKIAWGRQASDGRLDEDIYIPWKEPDFRTFLKDKCNLRKELKIKGRVVKDHVEAFDFWEELIDDGQIEAPFQVTHIDAHTDLQTGYPNTAMLYLLGELLHIPLNRRLNELNKEQMNSANYLAYAIACGFFSNVEMVLHPDYENENLPTIFFSNCDVNSSFLEMKAYDKTQVRYGTPKETIKFDNKIPFKIVTDTKHYNAKGQYDYVLFCQSPEYTPQSADFTLEVIKEYIIEI
ncbi:UPF0489 family protein [Oceanobacillus saliphilus]|uniref:UPF0489 family protein n=1 Tax=Oceanobacillus saliphilus TaxID=2925834 RepID=UPI00201DAECC|nr:UPF0489 family protein [Oceanobacillus saliphilus]